MNTKKMCFFYTCCQSPIAMKQNLMAAGWHFLSCHPNCHRFIEAFFEQSEPDDSATGFELVAFSESVPSASTVVRARAWQSVHHLHWDQRIFLRDPTNHPKIVCLPVPLHWASSNKMRTITRGMADVVTFDHGTNTSQKRSKCSPFIPCV